jgi:hypothetical protein
MGGCCGVYSSKKDTVSKTTFIQELISQYDTCDNTIIAVIDSVTTNINASTDLRTETLAVESVYVSIIEDLKQTIPNDHIMLEARSNSWMPNFVSLKGDTFLAFFNSYNTPYDFGLRPLSICGAYGEETGYFIVNNSVVKKGTFTSYPGLSIDMNEFINSVSIKGTKSNFIKPSFILYHTTYSSLELVLTDNNNTYCAFFYDINGKSIKSHMRFNKSAVFTNLPQGVIFIILRNQNESILIKTILF